MSRARTLAGAIGSDGALNVADVAGLAAVASSGSASDLSTGNLAVARLPNAGYELSDKNFIINGAFNVWQRGTSFTRDQLSNAQYAADRFWVYSYSASSGTVDRSTDVPSGEVFLYSFANNLNSNVPYGTNVELLAQGSAAPFVNGSTYTLSFWVKGSSAASGLNISINWRNSHADSTNSTAAVASNPTYNVTTSWTKVVLTFTLNSTPQANNRILDFEGNFLAGSKITGWKLEPGSAATPFIHRHQQAELALCQRYYEKSYGQGVTPVNGAIGDSRQGPLNIFNSNSGESAAIRFAVTKRASPTVVCYNSNNTGAAAGQWSIYNGGWTGASTSINACYDSYFTVALNSLSGVTNYATYITSGGWSASSEL